MARWLRTCIAFILMLGNAANAAIMPNQVCIYEHQDFVGASRCFLLGPGMRHKLVPTLDSGMNDRASSVQVGNEVAVIMWKHAHFRSDGGTYSYHFLESTRNLGDANDKVSSMMIVRKGEANNLRGVSLSNKYEDNAFYPLPERLDQAEARYPSLGEYNDKAGIAYLDPDREEVTLYEHANFAGKSLTLPGAVPLKQYQYFLSNYQFGERASSLVVRARGDIPIAVKPPSLPPRPPPRGGEGPAGGSHRAPPAPMAITPKTVTAIQPGSGLEMNTNRPGQDYRNFDLSAPDPKACQTACLEDMKCRAYTYIKPGIQGPNARCWLKSGIPPAESAPCCVSGVK